MLLLMLVKSCSFEKSICGIAQISFVCDNKIAYLIA